MSEPAMVPRMPAMLIWLRSWSARSAPVPTMAAGSREAVGEPAAEAAACPAIRKLVMTVWLSEFALMRMNQKNAIRMRFFRSETKRGTGSSCSMTHQISAQVMWIAARRMKRFWAIGRIAAWMPEMAAWNCATSVLAIWPSVS
jgi:hypothetical protein